jgi:peptidoglycan/xylan/chitin deacetylase (PgdA/CDA1 family)
VPSTAASSRSPVLPDGFKCALALTFDVDAEAAILAVRPSAWRDAMAMTHQAFGPRVGVPRILRLLEEERIRATFFVPGWTARRWPGAVESILAAGHEIGHHSDAHRAPVTLTASEERRDFEQALETLQRFGVSVTGHRAPMWQPTWTTLEIVAEHGLEYDSSLMDDDRPYVLNIFGRRLAELPVHWSLDDWEQYAFLPAPEIGNVIEPPSKLVELWCAELDAQRLEGGLVVGTMHPFLSGRASRVEALRTVIDHARTGGVWIAPLSEIAQRTLTADGVDERSPNPPDVSLSPYGGNEEMISA